jgi:hypothetical protein
VTHTITQHVTGVTEVLQYVTVMRPGRYHGMSLPQKDRFGRPPHTSEKLRAARPTRRICICVCAFAWWEEVVIVLDSGGSSLMCVCERMLEMSV